MKAPGPCGASIASPGTTGSGNGFGRVRSPGSHGTIAPRDSGLDDAQLSADLLEGRQDPVQVLGGVGGHVAGPNEGAPLGDPGADRGVRKDTSSAQALDELEGELIVAEDHRDDGGLALASVEAQGGQLSLHPRGILPQPLPTLRLVLDDIQGSANSGRARRRQAGAEEEGG